MRDDGSKQVTIEVPITYTGEGITPSIESDWNSRIESEWSGEFGDFDVTTSVTTGSMNTISVPSGNGRAYVNGVGGNTGTWPSSRPSWTAAHEAGHLMGLPDRYDYKTMAPKSGFENNIMSTRDKGPSAENISNILKANNCECK